MAVKPVSRVERGTQIDGVWKQGSEEIIWTNQGFSDIKRMNMILAGHVARVWEARETHKILVGKPESKKPLVKSVVNGRLY